MTKYKVSVHCGQVSAFIIREHNSKQEAFDQIEEELKSCGRFLQMGDAKVCQDQITFITVEELVERAEDADAAGATIEA